MRLRTQFTLAFFLLAVLPLAALVLFNYVSSQRALRQAVEREAEILTDEMDYRMAAVRRDLARRVHRVGELPFRTMLASEAEDGAGERLEFHGQILDELGEAAPFVQTFEFAPRPAPPPEVAVLPSEIAEPAPPAIKPPRPAFVVDVAKIVAQVEAKIEEGLEGEDIEEDKKIALEKAKAGVEAAAVLVEGIGRLAEFFTSGEGEALDLGEIELDLGGGEQATAPAPGAPPPARVTIETPEAPAPTGPDGQTEEEAWADWEKRFAAWEVAWDEQQKRWQRTYYTWKQDWEAEQEQHEGESGRQSERELEEQRLALEREHERIARRAAEAREETRSAEPDDTEAVWRTGREFYVPVREEGKVVGAVKAKIAREEVLRGVLARARRDRGEIPFAVDEEGNLFTLDEEDRGRLEALPLAAEDLERGETLPGDWVVATSQDPDTGLTYGLARPIGDSLAEIRRTAASNLAWGVGLIGLALVGMRPLSRRLTRSLQQLNTGVERIAQGDLDARVQVRSRNEVGQLARAFNHMADELKEHQGRLLEEERRRRDQEVEKKLLEAEYARKSGELEEARRFQLSLLPTRLPESPAFELAVHMRTATEVGGDYYDFRQTDEALVCAIGDATGHGARAGTMVTVIKSLFSAFPPEAALAGFLSEAAQAIKRMDLGRMAMALTLARVRDGRVTLSAAGMPPGLLYRRRSGEVEELLVEGMPLGGLSTSYREREVESAPGDTLLLLTDGLPELPNADGEPFGYSRVLEAFGDAASGSPQEIVESLSRAAEDWAGPGPPNDDITFVVLRVR